MPKKKVLTEQEELDKWHASMKAFVNVKGEGGMTLEEVATVLGCTRERVRQIENMALRKLKKALRKRGIVKFKDISADMPSETNPLTFD